MGAVATTRLTIVYGGADAVLAVRQQFKRDRVLHKVELMELEHVGVKLHDLLDRSTHVVHERSSAAKRQDWCHGPASARGQRVHAEGR